jgi:hypothetical protein
LCQKSIKDVPVFCIFRSWAALGGFLVLNVDVDHGPTVAHAALAHDGAGAIDPELVIDVGAGLWRTGVDHLAGAAVMEFLAFNAGVADVGEAAGGADSLVVGLAHRLLPADVSPKSDWSAPLFCWTAQLTATTRALPPRQPGSLIRD